MGFAAPHPDLSAARDIQEQVRMLNDAYTRLRKELEYSLNNLDMSNVNQTVFIPQLAQPMQDVLAANEIIGMHISGALIEGTEISGGSLNINDVFIVDEEGNMICTSATITGQLTILEGSSGFDNLSDAESAVTTIVGNTVTTQYLNAKGVITDTLVVGTNVSQGTAARVFTSQPVPPYSIGDVWTAGPNGDIKRCKTARATGSYSASDWELGSKYTDDSGVTTIIGNTVTTGFINALNVTAASVAAENITGTKISGKKFYGADDSKAYVEVGSEAGSPGDFRLYGELSGGVRKNLFRVIDITASGTELQFGIGSSGWNGFMQYDGQNIKCGGGTWYHPDESQFASRTWVGNQGYAAGNHTHDDRYYTESEADARFVKNTGNQRLIFQYYSGTLELWDGSTLIGYISYTPA